MTPAAALLARPRLLRELSGRWKVAVLSAPAGYGKTTLAMQFARRRAVLWCRLHEEDRDPAHLLGTLLAAGLHLRPPVGARTLAYFESRRDMERDGGFLTASLLAELSPARGERFVVVEDVHVLAEGRAALRWLRTVIEESGPRVRFVLTCRGECPVPLARLDLLGGAIVLSARDLEFTDPEQAELLRRVFRLRVDAGEERELRRTVGGWAAGIVLAAQRLRDGGALPSLQDRASGERLRGLLDFLAEEVISTLPHELQEDLCRAALVEDLDRKAVGALLGKKRGEALLQEIARRDLFVRTLADGAGAPRFHPLLREYLRGRLDREAGPEERRRLIGRLARHWAKCGAVERAIRTLAEGDLLAEAVSLFDRAAERDDAAGERWLRPVASDLASRIEAGLPRLESAWIHLHAAFHARDAGRLEDSARLARRAQAGFLAQRRHLTAARAFGAEASVALMTERLREALESGQALFDRLPRGHRAARGIVLLHSGDLSLHAGEPARARRLLEEAVRLLRAARLEIDAADAAVRRASVEYTEGRWEVYLLWAGRALPVFRRSGYAGRAESLLINTAEALVYLGEEERALAQLDEARALSGRSGVRANRTHEAIGRARVASERGRLEEAARLFDEARAVAARQGPPVAGPQIDVWEGILERRRGRLERAGELLDRAVSAFEALESPSWLALARMERALVAGLEGDADRALADLGMAARVSTRLGDRKERARNALYEARVLQVAGRPWTGAFRRALHALVREDHLVALRKEADVAQPLLAACEDRRLVARVTAALPPSMRPAIAPRTGAPRVEIRLLGGFEVRVDGRPAVFARRASEALVAFLALRHGQPVRREALAEALWANAEPEASRNRFDVALNAARRSLEPGVASRGPFRVLLAERGMCRLSSEEVRTDVGRFEEGTRNCEDLLAPDARARIGRAPSEAARLMRAARPAARDAARRARTMAAAISKIREALSFYGGDLLPGLAGAEWVEAERERLRERAHRLLLAEAGLTFLLGRLEETLAAARRVLAADALNEEAERFCLRVRGARGERAAVLASYRRFARRMRRDLGAAPSPETRALVRDLLGLRRPGDASRR